MVLGSCTKECAQKSSNDLIIKDLSYDLDYYENLSRLLSARDGHLTRLGELINGQQTTSTNSLSLGANRSEDQSESLFDPKKLLIHLLGLAMTAKPERVTKYYAETTNISDLSDSFYITLKHSQLFYDTSEDLRAVDAVKLQFLLEHGISTLHINNLFDSIKTLSELGFDITTDNLFGCGLLRYVKSTKHYSIVTSVCDVYSEINILSLSKIQTSIQLNTIQELRYVHQIIQTTSPINNRISLILDEYTLNVSSYQLVSLCADQILRLQVGNSSSIGEYEVPVSFNSVRYLSIFELTEYIPSLSNLKFPTKIQSVIIADGNPYGYNSFLNIPDLSFDSIEFQIVDFPINLIPKNLIKSFSCFVCSKLDIQDQQVIVEDLFITDSYVVDLSKFTVTKRIDISSVQGNNKVNIDGNRITIDMFDGGESTNPFEYMEFSNNVKYLR
jgi:hypothetical protein